MAGRKPLGGALTAFVEAFLAIPSSWSQKKQAAALAGDIHPVSRPDSDNFGKAALDSCNGIVWVDDAQVVMLQVQKKYSDYPRLRISVWAWDDLPAAEPEFI